MADVVMHPGDVWKNLIGHAGVTQVFVAGQMGISTKHLSQILHKHRLPSAMHTVAFAQVMGADARKLWTVVCELEITTAERKFRLKRPQGLPEPPEEWAS